MRQVDMGATFICGTGRDPPVNPMLTYAVDCLKLGTRPKLRDGPHATALYDRCGADIDSHTRELQA